MDAANALFAERPYDEVSIESIASAARRRPRARAMRPKEEPELLSATILDFLTGVEL